MATTPEAQESPLLNPEVTAFIKENRLTETPVLAYGRCAASVRWHKNQDVQFGMNLGLLALFGKNESVMSELLHNPGFHVLGVHNDRTISSGEISGLSERSPFHNYLISQTGRLLKMDLTRKYDAGTDLFIIDHKDEGASVLIGWQPSVAIRGGGRGNWDCFLCLQVTNDQANTLSRLVQQHPGYAYELIKALFPCAFTPSVTTDTVIDKLSSINADWLKTQLTRMGSLYTPDVSLVTIKEKIDAEKLGLAEVIHDDMSIDEALKLSMTKADLLASRVTYVAQMQRAKPFTQLWYNDLRSLDYSNPDAIISNAKVLKK